MPREIDERKKRKALRKLRKAAELAERGEGPPLSDWEREFLEEVEERIETYGSAFADPDKGNPEEPLSSLQTQKLREIDKKARGKGGGFKTRKPLSAKKKTGFTPRVRQLDEDIEEEAPPEPTARTERPALNLVRGSELSPPEKTPPARPPRGKPALRLVTPEPDEET